MQRLNSYEEVLHRIKDNFCLIYVHTEDCGVCIADQPRVKELCLRYGLAAYEIDPFQIPLIRGQWSLFTVPVVLLFYNGKEMHRQARIIDFRELEYRIAQFSNLEE